MTSVHQVALASRLQSPRLSPACRTAGVCGFRERPELCRNTQDRGCGGRKYLNNGRPAPWKTTAAQMIPIGRHSTLAPPAAAYCNWNTHTCEQELPPEVASLDPPHRG